MNENDWMIFNRAEADGTNSSEDILYNQIDLVDEVRNVDARFVEQAYTGDRLAGQEIMYGWKYNQLTMRVGKEKAKGGLRSGIHRAIVNSRKYLTISKEISMSGNWTILVGTLHVKNKNIAVKVLMHSLSIIGIYKEKANLDKTISWFEKNIYRNNWKQMKVNNIRDYKPEQAVEGDIYAKQIPEFTREAELEEIRIFIASLQGRRTSGEEDLLLKEIRSEIELILVNTW